MSKVLNDVSEIRQRARRDIESGAITPSYTLDPKAVIKRLNEALATELVCVLRYRRHYFMANGIDSEPVAAQFLEHSNEELGHADKLAKRIRQLGGEPNFNPDTLSGLSHAEYVEGHSLSDMIKENVIAERIAIESYRDIIAFVGDADSTTRRMLEEILEVEEEHADELADLLKS
ncbi:MAG: bacterioferritin [Cyanobacteria bacterium SZAS LIN-2]|nr:bacterioferritin [Cyanobacteria bacterium SZAS LIN-3]MBS1996689.1 bacterioferritin [Cyanobacteria bacterium SZAS LIN-2]MBS2005996.1 bacterioferritin [Cyanobacteria bacterium SZAS TMP-1]